MNYTAPLIEIVNASGNYSIVHCHGRLNDILEPIADMRPHALEPLEVLPTTTADLSMADVKRRIGERVCLMGGIQAAELETLPAVQAYRNAEAAAKDLFHTVDQVISTAAGVEFAPNALPSESG